ncbi:MAG: A24 family peptidase [Chloroflexi bacterium]|nr:A24 family peptidase [Chloroflexota bacterium]
MSVPAVVAIGALFALGGAAAERLASVWPARGAQGRRPGIRTAALAVLSAAAAGAIAARSALPWWATAAYLSLLAILVVLVATDLEQRRLPHLLLDPLIVLAALFIPFNPGVPPVLAIIGGLSAPAALALLALVVRGGLARGDLLFVVPIGFILGFPVAFIAVFAAAFLASGASIVLMARRRVGMRSYIPFGPFLVSGTALTLLFDERVLGPFR